MVCADEWGLNNNKDAARAVRPCVSLQTFITKTEFRFHQCSITTAFFRHVSAYQSSPPRVCLFKKLTLYCWLTLGMRVTVWWRIIRTTPHGRMPHDFMNTYTVSTTNIFVWSCRPGNSVPIETARWMHNNMPWSSWCRALFAAGLIRTNNKNETYHHHRLYPMMMMIWWFLEASSRSHHRTELYIHACLS